MNEKKRKSNSYKWLKISFCQTDKPLRFFWVISKKNIPLAVTRNRLKRWGRLFLKEEAFKKSLNKNFFKGDFLIFFLKKEKAFYKELKKTEFDEIFYKVFEDFIKDDRAKE